MRYVLVRGNEIKIVDDPVLLYERGEITREDKLYELGQEVKISVSVSKTGSFRGIDNVVSAGPYTESFKVSGQDSTR